MKSVAIFLAISSACATPALATIHYSITSIKQAFGPNPPTFVIVNGLNNAGHVAGFTQSPPSQVTQPFEYGNSVINNVTPFSGLKSSVAAINNLDQIVGSYAAFSFTGNHSYLYSPATHSLTDIPPIGGIVSTATGVNDSGLVVGYSNFNFFANQNHAFTFSNAHVTDLGTLGGTNSAAYGVNSAGTVVGAADLSGGVSHAFKYTGSTMSDLGTLAGGTNSVANAINTSGVIVGDSTLTGGVSHAISITGTTMSDLGTLGGANSSAKAINSSGQIVGISDVIGSSTQHAFLYSSGSMLDLNDMIDPASGYLLNNVLSINDSGQILVTGNSSTSTDYLLLTPLPIPEPTTLAVLGAGSLLLITRRGRTPR